MKGVLAIDLLLIIIAFFIIPAVAQNWNDSNEWNIIQGNSSFLKLSNFIEGDIEGIKAEFDLRNAPEESWVSMQLKPDQAFDPEVPIVFNLSANASCDLEIKMVDNDGTVYLRRIPMVNDRYKNWTPFVVYLGDLDFGWPKNNNGDFKKFKQFEKFELFELAFTSKRNETGTVWITGAGFGTKGLNSSLFDKNISLRRSEQPSPENPMVLEWLKAVQDNASPDGILLPSNGINHSIASTYDNSLVAMAFMLKGERERAERILDFYANATNICNRDPELQNFFYKGEARGFFQQVAIENITASSREVKAYHVYGPSDRWLGDMCWLMLAYKYYEKKYDSQKYDRVECLLTGLLLSWYNSTGGYIESGWRKNGTLVDAHLHEKNKDGHPEANIDAYAVMMLYNESGIASNISKWLDNKLGFGSGYPLDHYTWRNLSGETDDRVLSYPDTDLRYMIALDYQGEKIMGVWDGFIENNNTIWVEGVGQLACAFYEAGDPEKGNYYANLMDRYLQNETIGGRQYVALTARIPKDPPTAASSTAWYVFAKNQFNPMKLKSKRNSIP